MSEGSHEVIYRPDSTERRRSDYPNRRLDGFYLVTQDDLPLFAYMAAYYPSARDVVADMIGRRDQEAIGLEGTEWGSMDFVVWRNRRIMAVVHQDFTCEEGSCKTLFFSESGNDPGPHNPSAGWPLRDDWIASGRPDMIVLTREDMKRNAARAQEGWNIQEIPLDDIHNPFEADEDDA